MSKLAVGGNFVGGLLLGGLVTFIIIVVIVKIHLGDAYSNCSIDEQGNMICSNKNEKFNKYMLIEYNLMN